MNNFIIRNATPADAESIFHLSYAVYGDTLDIVGENDYIPTWSLVRHIQRFADGVFVADTGTDIVGFAITLRTAHSPYKTAHGWLEAIGGVELTAHDPRGLWIYGVDFGVHRAYRKQGIGTALYRARFDMVRRLNLKGFYAGGMLAGYKAYHDQMTIEEYVKRVRQGTLDDPTITMQLNRGFKPGAVLKHYCGKSLVNDSAMQIIWHNVAYA